MVKFDVESKNFGYPNATFEVMLDLGYKRREGEILESRSFQKFSMEHFGLNSHFPMALFICQVYVCALSPKNTHIESSQLVSDIKYHNRMDHFHG